MDLSQLGGGGVITPRFVKRDTSPMATSIDGRNIAVGRDANAVDLNRARPDVRCSRYLEVQPRYKRFRHWVRRVFA